jgi:hypothetical protein
MRSPDPRPTSARAGRARLDELMRDPQPFTNLVRDAIRRTLRANTEPRSDADKRESCSSGLKL